MLKIARGRALDRVRATLAAYNRMWPEAMKDVPSAEWPADIISLTTTTALRVWRSRYFLAVLYAEPNKATHRLSICRTQLNNDVDYQDGLSWDELMRVKSECGFADCDAVEIYPRDRDVVNVANLRHLWILPELSDLAWRTDAPSREGA